MSIIDIILLYLWVAAGGWKGTGSRNMVSDDGVVWGVGCRRISYSLANYALIDPYLSPSLRRQNILIIGDGEYWG